MAHDNMKMVTKAYAGNETPEEENAEQAAPMKEDTGVSEEFKARCAELIDNASPAEVQYCADHCMSKLEPAEGGEGGEMSEEGMPTY